MKCNIIYMFFMLLMLLNAMQSYAQGKANVEVSNLSVKQENGQMLINMIVKSECLEVHTAQSLWLDITLENEERVLQLPALVYTGKQRYRFDERNNRLAANETTTPHQIFKGIGEKTVYLSDYACQIPYSEWMDNASLRLKCIFHDCCDEWLVAEKVLMAIADTHPVIVEEPLEPVKVLTKEVVSKKFATCIYYEFKSDKLLASHAGNQITLNRIDSLIQVIALDEEINLRAIKIIGYSSPEGTYHFNKELAQKRYEGFKAYLVNKYGLDGQLIDGSWIAEDWDGVLRVLESTEIDHKNKVVDLIHQVGIFKGREVQLMNLAGGRPYLQMMDRIFPSLRRIELEIDYDVIEYK